MSDVHPSELRALMEAEARRRLDDLRAGGEAADPSVIAALVMESFQTLPSVRGRIELLWRYVEDYVRDLD
jgi:hypothetical protein